MAAAYVSADLWPIIVITVSDNMELDAYAKMFSEYEVLLKRKETCITLSDLRRINSRPNAKIRALAAERSREWRPLVERYSLGDARVLTSSIVRGALTAVGWLYQHPKPIKYFGTMGEGISWCSEQLTLVGVEPPRQTHTAER